MVKLLWMVEILHPSEYESGYWIGPTTDYVNPDWACATDEIFGPVLSIIRVPTIGKAMEIEKISIWECWLWFYIW